jgi:hypothetical protein
MIYTFVSALFEVFPLLFKDSQSWVKFIIQGLFCNLEFNVQKRRDQIKKLHLKGYKNYSLLIFQKRMFP